MVLITGTFTVQRAQYIPFISILEYVQRRRADSITEESRLIAVFLRWDFRGVEN